MGSGGQVQGGERVLSVDHCTSEALRGCIFQSKFKTLKSVHMALLEQKGKKPSTGECVQDATVCAGKARSLMCGAALEGQPPHTQDAAAVASGRSSARAGGRHPSPLIHLDGWISIFFLSFYHIRVSKFSSEKKEKNK